MKRIYMMCLALLLCLVAGNELMAQGHTTLGTDFWCSFGRNEHYGDPTPGVPNDYHFPRYQPQLRVSATKATKVTITFTNLNSGHAEKTLVKNLQAGEGFTHTLTDDQILATYSVAPGTSTKSVHIVSDQPVSAYALSQAHGTTDATNILPVTSLGTDYYHISHKSFTNGYDKYVDGYTIVAVEAGTEVRDGKTGTLLATLSTAGSVYSYYSSTTGDLTGTYIKTSKPAAYFVTNSGTSILNKFTPERTSSCDVLFQQMMPISSWGNKFLVPLTLQKRERVRILASENGTNLTIQGTYTTVTGSLSNMNAGSFAEIEITSGCYISANKAIGVCSFLMSAKNYGESAAYGDPANAWIPPLAQTVDTIAVSPFIPSASTLLQNHYALIVTSTANRNATKMATGNGNYTSLSSSDWVDHASGFSYRSILLYDTYNSASNLQNVSYSFTNPDGVIVFGYGLGNTVTVQSGESYYYLAGAATRSINPSFYVNGIHHDDVRGRVFCGPQVKVDAAIYSRSATNFYVKWWIDGVYASDLGTTSESWTKTLSPGKHTIRMEVNNYFNIADVRETEFTINIVSIDDPGTSTVFMGETKDLTGRGFPTTLNGYWMSSDPSIATVTNLGLSSGASKARVTPVREGTVTIYYFHNGCSASTTLTVGALQCPFYPRTYVKDYSQSGVTQPANGVKDGSSWANAYDGLADVLKAAADNPGCIQEIWVAAGTYSPAYTIEGASNARYKSFTLVPGVKMYGGFPKNAKDGVDRVDFSSAIRIDTRRPIDPDSPDQSILSGVSNNAYHVVLAAGIPYYATETSTNRNTVLDGFVIKGGSADNTTAGIMVNGTPVLQRYGGGMVSVESSPLLNRIIFENNMAYQGGALLIESGTPRIANTIFRNNTGVNNGGAIYLSKTSTGLAPHAYFLNTLMHSNNTGGDGGAMYLNAGARATLVNTTLSKNVGNTVGGIYTSSGCAINLYNSILWDNTTDEIGGSGSLTREYSLVKGLDGSGTGNIVGTTNPLFVNPAAGNYRLNSVSPVIDKASSSRFTTLDAYFGSEGKDLKAGSRIINSIIDLGPYEIPKTDNLWIGAGGTGKLNASPNEATKHLWSVKENWTGQVIPGPGEMVLYHDNAIDLWVDGHYNVAGVNNQNSPANLVVLKEKSLEITTTSFAIRNGGRLKIRAGVPDASNADGYTNGSFISPSGLAVSAQVELYSKAKTEAGETNPDRMTWQFFGVPVTTTSGAVPGSIYAYSFLTGTAVRKYTEGTNTYWSVVNPNDPLEPYKGYELSWWNGHTSNGLFTFDGYLLNTNKTLTLSRTTTAGLLFPGQHVVSNPYTAGLKINGGLAFGGGMEKVVYLFHTGTSRQWDNWAAGLTGDGAGPGQYIAVPQKQAGQGLYLPETLSSMQGFVVKTLASSGNTLTFQYDGGVKANNSLLRSAPAEEVKKVCSVISLSNKEALKDRLWLFTEPQATRGFDDGYDGRKIVGSNAFAQLYAVEEDGNYQVNTVPDVHNTYLAFKAEEGVNEYTLTFNHQQFEEAYQSLYLIDLVKDSRKWVDVTGDGATYSFTAHNTGSAEKRFKLVTETRGALGVDEMEGCRLDVIQSGNGLLITACEEKAEVSIYNVAGMLVYQTILMPYQNEQVNAPLTPGVYLVYAKLPDTTVTRKVVVR